MARPRGDGLPFQPPNKRKAHGSIRRRISSEARTIVWDTQGAAGWRSPSTRPGRKVWKCIYPFQGRTRWYTIGRADAVNLKDARKLAGLGPHLQVGDRRRSSGRAKGCAKPRHVRGAGQAVRRAARQEEKKTWMQNDAQVRKHLLPKWGKLRASTISRSDVKSVMAGIASPGVANLTLASASAIFSWAIKEDVGGVKVNPCQHVDRMEMKAASACCLSSKSKLSGKNLTTRASSSGVRSRSCCSPASVRAKFATCGASTSSTDGGRCPAIPCQTLDGRGRRTPRTTASGFLPPRGS